MSSNDKDSATSLLRPLRKFSSEVVKISQENTQRAKEMISNNLEPILALCRKNNKDMVSHHEYTGSFYERLKTEAPDEIDIMVALKGKGKDLEVHEKMPGYALLQPKESSPFADSRFTDKFLIPSKVREWFFGLVQKAVNEFKKLKENGLKVDLVVSANGPAVTLVMTEKESEDQKKTDDKKMELSVDLVPAFLLSRDKHFVAKPFQTEEPEKTDDTTPLLWRQSFSLKEKELLKKIDKPKANTQCCRHELVRITKTFRRKDSTLAKLTSYHIKTAFFHYKDKIQDEDEWATNKLGIRFIDFLQFIMQKVKEGSLPNYFIPDLNLLHEFRPDTLTNIEGRLNKLVSNPQECIKILKKHNRTLPFSKNNKKRLKIKQILSQTQLSSQ